jgi:predicted glutamine amidotransferase
MCGLAGYSGPTLTHLQRNTLALYLGDGIDRRGGHAIGYAAPNATPSTRPRPHRGHALGTWNRCSNRFMRDVMTHTTVAMHARFATCGKRTVDEAHPFTIDRTTHTIIGMHNGIIGNSDESAWARNRVSPTVDSHEIFECIADDEPLSHLEGYGVIVWIDTRAPSRVNVARLGEHSDLYLVKAGDAIVWGSTPFIVNAACSAARLPISCRYEVDEPGRRYYVESGRVFTTEDCAYLINDPPRNPSPEDILDFDTWQYYIERDEL